MKSESITTAVEEHYAAVARGEASACGAPVEDVARSIGYSDEELALAGDANLGLGCGNPLALTEIKPGMTVLDLGSGAGFDAFLALHRVGPTGKVIGVDMTDDMLALARGGGAEGINIAGICCTANEILMRQGMPIAGNYLHQELALLTGAVDLMVVCVDAGLGLDQALLRTGQELGSSHSVLAEELVQINLEQRAGKPRIDAWRDMADRTQLEMVKGFANMLAQSDRFGTPVSKALSTFADGLRKQRSQQAEEMAAKSTIKLMFPLVLFIFPSMFIVLLGPAALLISRNLGALGGN